MSPDAIDRAIAEFCGWTEIQCYPESGRLWGNRPGSEGESYRLNAVPQFHRCLNAMAEAESMLLPPNATSYIQYDNYRQLLNDAEGRENAFRAIAMTRAITLLRTIGKYQEPEKLSTHCAV